MAMVILALDIFDMLAIQILDIALVAIILHYISMNILDVIVVF